MLSLYRSLLLLRRAEHALSFGDYVPVASTEQVLAFERRYGDRRLLIALNLTGRLAQLHLHEVAGEVLLSTEMDRYHERIGDVVGLAADEGVILARGPSPQIS